MKRQISYKPKNCEKCGGEYTPTSATQSWCEKCLIKICGVCGKPFRVRNKSKYDKSLYCSNDCGHKGWAAKYKGEKAPNYRNGNTIKSIEIECSVCGTKVLRKQGQLKWKNCFCSPQCRGKYQSENTTGTNNPKYSKVDVVCEQCGKSYKTYNCTQDKTRFCSKECRHNWQAWRMMGENHPLWNGGSSEERSRVSVSREYKKWRLAVFERDCYTCQCCGDKKGGNLNAHHIKSFAKYPEKRFDVDNGITLCEKCHIKEHAKDARRFRLKEHKDIQSGLR